MGNLLARFRHRDVRIILLGLDSAGKTTILYRLKLDDLVTTIPTIGFNVESIQYKDLHLTAWDIGSRDKIRPLFRHYYKGADAVVFVIDSHDPERLDELNYDVIKPAVNAEELTNAVFLFLANKIDLPDTMPTDEISEKLGLRFLKHPWGILPVSAVSGEGLQAALEWLAVRLGSAQVKARNFTVPAQPKSIQQCRTQSSLSSSSSTATSKTDNSKRNSKGPVASQKPIIFVNSKLYMDTVATPSPSSGSMDNASAMSVSTPGSTSYYSAYIPKRTPGTVMNSFSSYSIAQSMKDDISRRSAISRSDIRKLSCASLNDAAGARKYSTTSMLDSPSQRKMSSVSLMDSPYRRKMSTSFVIEQPSYRKFSTTSLMDTALSRKHSAASLGDGRIPDSPYARKFSATSLGEPQANEISSHARKLSAVSLGDSQDEPDKPKMTYLTAGPNAVGTPPTAKRKSEDTSGFGSFTPIMANYINNDRKDSDTSADSLNLVSPSDHIQPHLRPLGLKKSPFLSSSGKYVVNSIEAMKDEHYQEILRLLPERYTHLYSGRDSFSNDTSYTVHQNPAVLNGLDDANVNNVTTTTTTKSPNKSNKNNRNKKLIFKSSKQQSQDSDSSCDSSNEKRTHLDLFCTPTRRSHSQHHSRNRCRDRGKEVVSSRGAYCSRAYSAIKCLFFRPTKQEMQQETDSISSDDDCEHGNEKQENNEKCEDESEKENYKDKPIIHEFDIKVEIVDVDLNDNGGDDENADNRINDQET